MPRWLSLTSLATLLAFLVMVLPAGRAFAQAPPPPPSAPQPQPGGAQAVDPEMAQAQAHYKAGLDYYNANDFTNSIREWKAAQMIKPSPKLDYNIGMSYERLGRPRAAIKYYKKYIEGIPNAPNRAEVDQRIASLTVKAQRSGPGDEVGPAQPGAPQPPTSGVQSQPAYGYPQQGAPQGAYAPTQQPPPQGYAQPGQQPPQGYAQPGQPQQPPTYYSAAPAPVQPVAPPPAKKKSSNWWIVFPIIGGVLLTLMFIYLISASGESSRSYETNNPGGAFGGGGNVPAQEPALFRF